MGKLFSLVFCLFVLACNCSFFNARLLARVNFGSRCRCLLRIRLWPWIWWLRIWRLRIRPWIRLWPWIWWLRIWRLRIRPWIRIWWLLQRSLGYEQRAPHNQNRDDAFAGNGSNKIQSRRDRDATRKATRQYHECERSRAAACPPAPSRESGEKE